MFNFFSNQGYGNTGNYKIIHQKSCGAACRAMTLFCISEVLYSLGFRKLSPAVGFHMLCREGNQNLNKRTTAIIIIIIKYCVLSAYLESKIFLLASLVLDACRTSSREKPYVLLSMPNLWQSRSSGPADESKCYVALTARRKPLPKAASFCDISFLFGSVALR